jgi:hypothetical protein
MKRVAQVLEEAKKMGAGCTERNLWKYHKLDLLPGGRKIPGHGNVAYFPDDTALRIWIIHLLTHELRFGLSDISQYPWSQFEGAQIQLRPGMYPGELIFDAKNRYDKLKSKFVRDFIDKLIENLKLK